jgi:hypothetical protein
MEADWEYEIGPGAPVIDAAWPGLVNLVRHPGRVAQIAEAAAFPPLAQALVALNGAASSVWTSKCDLWPALEPGTWDPDEMDATATAAAAATGGYIDLLARDALRWNTPEAAAADCRLFCRQLHALTLGACRIDLVIREASLGPDRPAIGLTAYLTPCGATPAAARESLARALEALAAILAAPAAPLDALSPLQ